MKHLFACMMAVCMNGAGFAIVGYSQTVRSQMEGELTGTVTDIGEGAPIPKAYVLVHSEATNKDVGEKVSSRARFDVSLEPGDYDVPIAAPGFAPACKRVEIKSATTTDFSPKLGPDTEHMQIDTIY